LRWPYRIQIIPYKKIRKTYRILSEKYKKTRAVHKTLPFLNRKKGATNAAPFKMNIEDDCLKTDYKIASRLMHRINAAKR